MDLHDDSTRRVNYLYRTAKGQFLIATGNAGAVSVIINNELIERDRIRLFLKTRGRATLDGFLCENGWQFIDNSYFQSVDDTPFNRWFYRDPETSSYKLHDESDIVKSKEVVRKYVNLSREIIENNEWCFTGFYVALDGSVYKRELRGELYPFKIQKIESTLQEKSASVIPLPVF